MTGHENMITTYMARPSARARVADRRVFLDTAFIQALLNQRDQPGPGQRATRFGQRALDNTCSAGRLPRAELRGPHRTARPVRTPSQSLAPIKISGRAAIC